MRIWDGEDDFNCIEAKREDGGVLKKAKK